MSLLVASQISSINVSAGVADAGKVAVTNAAGKFDSSLLTYTPPAVVNDSTTARTLAIADANCFINFSNTASITVTVPPDSSVNFNIGTEIYLNQDNTGQITINGGTGVTITTYASSLTTGHKLLGRYAMVTLKKVAANSWRLFGLV